MSDAVLLGRKDARGENIFFEKVTEGGGAFFGVRANARRFQGYDDPELVSAKALSEPLETFYEED